MFRGTAPSPKYSKSNFSDSERGDNEWFSKGGLMKNVDKDKNKKREKKVKKK